MGVNERQAMGNKKPSENWDDLRYFLAVARTGTLSAAAAQLGTEHTTVARHVHALEGELNSCLFHKSNSGYGLTDAGERLLAGAEAIESAYVSAKATASSEGQPIIGRVRIGAPDGFGSVFLAPRVRVLTDRHPQLEIEIVPSARLFSLLKREPVSQSAIRARSRSALCPGTSPISGCMSTPQGRIWRTRLGDDRLGSRAVKLRVSICLPNCSG